MTCSLFTQARVQSVTCSASHMFSQSRVQPVTCFVSHVFSQSRVQPVTCSACHVFSQSRVQPVTCSVVCFNLSPFSFPPLSGCSGWRSPQCIQSFLHTNACIYHRWLSHSFLLRNVQGAWGICLKNLFMYLMITIFCRNLCVKQTFRINSLKLKVKKKINFYFGINS